MAVKEYARLDLMVTRVRCCGNDTLARDLVGGLPQRTGRRDGLGSILDCGLEIGRLWLVRSQLGGLMGTNSLIHTVGGAYARVPR